MTLQQIENLEPDDKGIVTIMVGDIKKRYVKELLIKHLSKPGARLPFKTSPQKRTVGRPRIHRPVVVKKEIGSHKRRPVVAILPDGTEKQFISCKAAADELKINRMNIPHVLSGKYKQVYGIKFRRAETIQQIAF